MSFTSISCSRRSGILVCCWAVLIAPGCSRSVLTTEQGAVLAAAEERWKRGAPRDYSFVFHPISFPNLGQASARIEVRGGVVKSVAQLGRHDAGWTTIEELFGSIRHASESGRNVKIEATYDTELGYPTRIVFTAPRHVDEGNIVILIEAFEKLAAR